MRTTASQPRQPATTKAVATTHAQASFAHRLTAQLGHTFQLASAARSARRRRQKLFVRPKGQEQAHSGLD